MPIATFCQTKIKCCVYLGSIAAAVLPLAQEYQIDDLTDQCVKCLMQLEKPDIRIISLAQTHIFPELLDRTIDTCASKTPLSHWGYLSVVSKAKTIDGQLQLPENESITDDIINRILRFVDSMYIYIYFKVCR